MKKLNGREALTLYAELNDKIEAVTSVSRDHAIEQLPAVILGVHSRVRLTCF
jgi:hypothetical protein